MIAYFKTRCRIRHRIRCGFLFCCLGFALGIAFTAFGIVVTAHAAQSISPGVQLVTVDFVVDGDTVEIEGGERVRLLGIDTPENKRLRKNKDGTRRLQPAQPFYIEAKHFLRNLVTKKQVKIIVGEPSVGYYGRTLAYLYVPDGDASDIDVQQELIRRGYAMVTAYPPNVQHLSVYGKTEAEACRTGRGIWGHPHFALQNLEGNEKIRHGRGRVSGEVTSVTYTNTDIRIVLSERVRLLIHRGVWRKFWPGLNAKEFIGKRIIARGKIRPAGKNKTMRIRHPFMLRSEICGEGLAEL